MSHESHAELELDVDPPATPDKRERDPARIAASLLLAEATQSCGGLTGIVLLVPWSPAWSELLEEIWNDWALVQNMSPDMLSFFGTRRLDGIWRALSRENAGTPQQARNLAGEVAADLLKGHHFCAVSSAPERFLPEELVRTADHRLRVGPITPDLMRTVASSIASGEASVNLDAAACASLTPDMLRLVLRTQQSADDYIRRLAALAEPTDKRAEAAVITLDDLHGMDVAVAWGRDLAQDLAEYRSGKLPWAAVDRGALLVGPPGTGKTTFAQALARSCGVPLFAGSYAQWQTSGGGYLGDLLRAMAASFDAARKAAPSILFIDEINSFCARQGETRHRDWWTSVVNGLLQLLDGVEKRDGVVVVGATNYPELADPAIVRSGRLDRTLEIGLPDQAALAGILRVHLRDELAHTDLVPVAMQATGASGADAERWVRGARRRARRAARAMIVDDLLAEIVGTEQRSSEDVRRVAVHEAGHALLVAIEEPGRLRHVSIVNRADAHGAVALKPVDGLDDETTIEGTLRRMLAGRAAEQVVLGRISSGSGGADHSDLGRATALGLAAETALGFSRQPLLWRGVWDGNAAARVLLANPTLAERVSVRLEAAWEGACRTLQTHRGALDELIGRLLARGVLSGAEVEAMLAGRPIQGAKEPT